MDWRAHIGRWGGAVVPGDAWIRGLLFLLLCWAAVLRCWDLGQLPFMHDEISALIRVHPSLAYTITHGVMAVDVHPPGVQVFLWGWTQLFGMGPIAVRLPFVLLSLAGLFFLYRFAISWTHAGAALFVVAFLAVTQYGVHFGQLARPYAVGLFSTALMADQLTRFLAHGRRRHLVWMMVAAVISAYTQYFALLLAGLMALAGLFLIASPQRKAYFVACGIAVLLFAPALPILFAQLAVGGLSDWLPPPDRHWIPDMVKWATMYSLPFQLVCSALLVVALYDRAMSGTGSRGPSWVLVLWGLLPLAFGLGYSIWRAPIIQYSGQFFSFPYLLLLLFGALRSRSPRTAMATVLLVATTGTWALVEDRQHYRLMYHSKYDTMIDTGRAVLDERGANGTGILLDAPPEVLDFLLGQRGLTEEDLPLVQLRAGYWTTGRLDSLLDSWSGRTVVLGLSPGAPAELVARVQAHHPSIQRRMDMLEGQVFVLQDGPGAVGIVQDRQLIAAATPAASHGASWDVHDDLPRVMDIDTDILFWDFNGREFGAAVELELDATRSPHDLYEVVATVSSAVPLLDAALVIELRDSSGTVFYRTAEWRELRPHGGEGELIVAACPADAGMRRPVHTLKAYIHSRDLGPLLVQGLQVYLRSGDPDRYGLFGPIPRHHPYRP